MRSIDIRTLPQRQPSPLRDGALDARPTIRHTATISSLRTTAPARAPSPLAAWMPPPFAAVSRQRRAGVLGALALLGRVHWQDTLDHAQIIGSGHDHVLVWCGYPREQLLGLRREVGRSGRVIHVWGAAMLGERACALSLVRQFLVIRVLWCEPWSPLPRPVPHWHRPQIQWR